MGARRRRWNRLLIGGFLLALVPSGTVAGSLRAASETDFVAKANAICSAGTKKLEAAASKLGDDPSKKQINRYVSKDYVPNIAGQIAKIRKLGFPPADKRQLESMFSKAEKDLARVARNPSRVLDDPFANVNPELAAYGLTECGGGDAGSSSPLDAIATALVGRYQGTWTNTTFGSTGTLDITVSYDAATTTVKAIVSITGNVFGSPAPAPETITIPLDTSDLTAKIAVPSAVFGQLTFSLQADGAVVAEAPNVPSANAATFRLVLRPSPTGADGTYSVGLRNGSTANGTVTSKKV